ncbi:PilW family protein [Acinetobacter nectaris]|uniref:PilW family protein n=1 Tax=Acinetobacter nectaris TaxID=1219382 RepID=UPI001EFF82D9|nr:PilW family protein [Acinetobacter nectaris]MCF9034244.1 PilW family protein [Acinetobacter nectaris]
MKKSIAGFTLIELMISLALGTIVTAAALMLFISGQRDIALQQASADIQSSGNFGLGFITKDIRLANLDAANTLLKRDTIYGGVVVTTSNYPQSMQQAVSGKNVFSSATGSISNVKDPFSGAMIGSAQLVIQFKAQNDGFNCEGKAYTAGNYIVERYFLREDTGVGNEPNKPLGLACEATSYVDGANGFNNSTFGSGSGQLIIRRVDYFHVLLNVSNNDNSTFKYLDMGNYATDSTNPHINAVQIGMLVRSNDGIGGNNLRSDQQYQVLNQSVIVNDNNIGTPFLRKVIQQTVALRNAGLGISDTVTAVGGQ